MRYASYAYPSARSADVCTCKQPARTIQSQGPGRLVGELLHYANAVLRWTPRRLLFAYNLDRVADGGTILLYSDDDFLLDHGLEVRLATVPRILQVNFLDLIRIPGQVA